MFDSSRLVNGVKISYNLMIDLGNILVIEDLAEKVDLEVIEDLLKSTKVLDTIKDITIRNEFKKEIASDLRLCRKLKSRRKQISFKDLAIECIHSNYALNGKDLTADAINQELNDLKLRLGGSAVTGISKSSLIDLDGEIRKANADKKLIIGVELLGNWVIRNCQEYEIELWNTLFKDFTKNPRNKNNRKLIKEYYDFLRLTDYDLVNEYGQVTANEIRDKFSTRLLKYN